MKKKIAIICPIALVIIVAVGMIFFSISHTYTLSGKGRNKHEQIQAIGGKVKVSGNSDTSVTFTDIESGETFFIGYITHGATETVKLEKGRWYTVEGNGELTLSPVNLRIE